MTLRNSFHFKDIFVTTLVYLIAEQAVISEQDGSFQKIVKQAGWNILENLISEQAEFHRKKPCLIKWCPLEQSKSKNELQF